MGEIPISGKIENNSGCHGFSNGTAELGNDRIALSLLDKDAMIHSVRRTIQHNSSQAIFRQSKGSLMPIDQKYVLFEGDATDLIRLRGHTIRF